MSLGSDLVQLRILLCTPNSVTNTITGAPKSTRINLWAQSQESALSTAGCAPTFQKGKNGFVWALLYEDIFMLIIGFLVLLVPFLCAHFLQIWKKTSPEWFLESTILLRPWALVGFSKDSQGSALPFLVVFVFFLECEAFFIQSFQVGLVVARSDGFPWGQWPSWKCSHSFLLFFFWVGHTQ